MIYVGGSAAGHGGAALGVVPGTRVAVESPPSRSLRRPRARPIYGMQLITLDPHTSLYA